MAMQPNRGMQTGGSAAAKRLAEEQVKRRGDIRSAGADKRQRAGLRKQGYSEQFISLPPDALGASFNPQQARPRERVTSNIPSYGMGRPDGIPTQSPIASRGHRTEPIQNWSMKPGKEVRSVLTQNKARPGAGRRGMGRIGGY